MWKTNKDEEDEILDQVSSDSETDCLNNNKYLTYCVVNRVEFIGF